MLTINDFPMRVLETLVATCTSYLKQWFGNAPCATPDSLYRKRSHHAFGFHAMTTLYRHLQVTRLHPLANWSKPLRSRASASSARDTRRRPPLM